MSAKRKTKGKAMADDRFGDVLSTLDDIASAVENTRAMILSGELAGANVNEDRGDRELLARAEAESAGHDLIPADWANRIFAGENPVRVFREMRGMKQKDLAKLAGLSQGFLSEIETGKPASAQVFKQLADILKIDMALLLPEGVRPETTPEIQTPPRAMHVYRLAPRLLHDMDWRASTWKKPVVIRAPSESAARWAASLAFGIATEVVPGRKVAIIPWRQVDMVDCQKIDDKTWPREGDVAILEPAEYNDEIPQGIAWDNL